MSLSNLGLGEKALSIASERPKYWEWFLCAQLIDDEINFVQNLLKYEQKIELVHPSKNSGIRNFDDLKNILGNFKPETQFLLRPIAVLSEVSPDNVEVFGPIGKPGNPAAILLLAKKFGNIYHEAIILLKKAELDKLNFEKFCSRDIGAGIELDEFAPVVDALTATNRWLISNLKNTKYFFEIFGSLLVRKINQNLNNDSNTSSPIEFNISSTKIETELLAKATIFVDNLSEYRNTAIKEVSIRNEDLDKFDKSAEVISNSNKSSIGIQNVGKFGSLLEFIEWLGDHERISLSVLRRNLLPLDLFPGAVIDDINEKALELVGEYALEEVSDQVVVNRTVLSQVISEWDRVI